MYVNDINSLISNKFRMKGKLEDGKTALDPKAVGKTIWLEKLPGLEVKLCFSLILEKLIYSDSLKPREYLKAESIGKDLLHQLAGHWRIT